MGQGLTLIYYSSTVQQNYNVSHYVSFNFLTLKNVKEVILILSVLFSPMCQTFITCNHYKHYFTFFCFILSI